MIKQAFIFILLCLGISAFAQNASYPDKPSTHGMMFMGNDIIYASHLPMFHSPHDYQIILILDLSEKDKLQYINDRKAHPKESVYTLEPENFVLPEMVNHTKHFKASIYRGHFERGGTKFIDNIPVSIKKIVYYHQFQKETTKPKQLQYLLFGNREEQFLVHKISAKPDFDENSSVKVKDPAVLSQLLKSNYISIEFSEKDLRKPFSWKQESGTSKETKKTVRFQNHKLLYLEYNDLN